MTKRDKRAEERRTSFRVWPEPRRKKFNTDGKTVVNYGPTLKQKFPFIEKILQFSEEQILKSLIIPLREWNKKYGYTEAQSYIQEVAVYPHKHSLDVFLFDGGNRSGKSASIVARVLQFLLENPGSTAVVGAENMPLLKRSAWEYWRQRLTIYEDWDHPLVSRKPNQHESRLRLTNGSQVWFIHFSDYRVLRGLEADIIHIEEASLLPSEDSMNELIRRLSGSKGPLRQLILTTNPEEDHGWIYTKFNLKQFEPDYEGDPLPIGERCKCQFCQECLDQREVEISWSDGHCLECGSEKEGSCPGDQQFFRVLRIASYENEHLPADYTQTAKSGMSEEYFRHYVKGQVGELRTGRVYKSYSKSNNVAPAEYPLNPVMPIYWSLDFNISFQCSVICQEYEDKDGYLIRVIDELVIPQAGPEDVAREFLKRYGEYDVPVYIYGDPTAFNNKISPNDVSQFKLITQILENPSDYGIDLPPREVYLMSRKERSNVVGKVDSTNGMLLDANGVPRILINPHCEWLQVGLSKVKWKEDSPGKSVIDEQCDKNAAKAADKTTVRPLTHICDGLAYLVYKRHPATVDLNQNPYIQAPGESIIEQTSKGIVEYSLLPEEDEDKNKGSFWDMVGEQEGWEDPNDEPFGFFGRNNFW